MLTVDLLAETTDLEQTRELFHESHPDAVTLTRELTRLLVGGGDVDGFLDTANDLDDVTLDSETRDVFRRHADVFDRFNSESPAEARTISFYVAGLGDVTLADAQMARRRLLNSPTDIELDFSVCIREEDLDEIQNSFIDP